ncbi:MAG: hypothetical protein P4M14_13690, partial [Gammaproteobacteria bacterium]|nr:hypothetical protein [Gammaproteobacteria bacterium]
MSESRNIKITDDPKYADLLAIATRIHCNQLTGGTIVHLPQHQYTVPLRDDLSSLWAHVCLDGAGLDFLTSQTANDYECRIRENQAYNNITAQKTAANLDKEVNAKNIQGVAAFHFSAVINQAQILLEKPNLFLDAARLPEPDILFDLIGKFHPAFVAEALKNTSLFNQIFLSQSGETAKRFLLILPSAYFNQTIQSQLVAGYFFRDFANCIPEDVVATLVSQLNDDNLKLLISEICRWFEIHSKIARHFLFALSPSYFNQAMQILLTNHLALLIDQTPDDTMTRIVSGLNEDNLALLVLQLKRCFIDVFLQQTPARSAAWLSHLPTLKLKIDSQLEKPIIHYLLNEPSWQNTQLIDVILANADSHFQATLLLEYAKGLPFPDILISKLKKLPRPEENQAKSAWEMLQAGRSNGSSQPASLPQQVNCDKMKITTSKGQTFLASDPDLDAVIMEQGLYLPEDYKKIAETYRPDSAVMKMIDLLCQRQKLFVGFDVNRTLYKDFQSGIHLEYLFNEFGESAVFEAWYLFPRNLISKKLFALQPDTQRPGLASIARHFSEAHLTTVYRDFYPAFIDTYGGAPKPQCFTHLAHFLCAVFLRQLSPELTLEIIRAVNKRLFNTIVNASHMGKKTILHIAAEAHSAGVLSEIISNISPKLVEELFVLQDENRHTVLHLAAIHQTTAGFDTLVSGISANTLSDVCRIFSNDGKSLLELAFLRQHPESIAKLLNKIDADTLAYLLTRGGVKDHVLLKIVDSLLNERSWQDKEFVQKIYAVLGNLMTDLLCAYWLDGHTIPQHLMTCFSENLFDPSLNAKPVKHLILQELHDPRRKWYKQQREAAEEKEAQASITTGQGNQLHLNNPNLVLTVWREGFRDVGQYLYLRNQRAMIPGATSTLDRLYQVNRITSGCMQDLPIESDAAITLEQVNDCILRGNGLAQLVHPDHWEENIRDLTDYDYRPEGGFIAAEEKDAAVQYDHLSGKIVAYGSTADFVMDGKHTRSLPVKLIGDNFNTRVLSEEEKKPAAVGIIYNLNQCVPTAMFSAEMIVDIRESMGSKEKVEQYAKKVKSVSFTDLDSFRQAIKQNRYQTNQVFARLSREAAVAIVIAEDSPSARKTALRYADDFRNRFDVILPVVFYNPILKAVHLYLPEARIEDNLIAENGKVTNILVEEETKARLLAFAANLKAKKDWVTRGFFGVKQDPATPPESVNHMIEFVEKAANNPNTFWSGAYQATARLLDGTIEKPSRARAEETQHFYVQ